MARVRNEYRVKGYGLRRGNPARVTLEQHPKVPSMGVQCGGRGKARAVQEVRRVSRPRRPLQWARKRIPAKALPWGFA
jgi:hypothetical protein